jgi:hypothetical protein
MNKPARVSEILLVVMLLVIIGFTRIYYGESNVPPMVVWKGGYSLKDTLVNVPEMTKLSRTELEQSHHDVFSQMEDMGLLEGTMQQQQLPKRSDSM